MADAGKLTLQLVWDGSCVLAVNVNSTRPMAAVLMRGKTEVQVLQLLPLLFSVCSKAQGAAAQAALAAARQTTVPDAAQAELAIRCEVLQEHLWRLLLDWPQHLQLPQQQPQFVKWYAMLREIAASKLEMSLLRAEFERDWLGMALSSPSSESSPAAQLLQQAREQDVVCKNEAALMPNWSAQQAYAACAGCWNERFARAPEWQGLAAETGAMSYLAGHAALSGATSTAKRLLARLLDTVELLQGGGTDRLDAYSPEPGIGLSLVHTARGMLMHHVELAGERVKDYVIVAPTEWNFHRDGAFVRGMLGVLARDEEDLKQIAHIMALSLDPCVAYEIEVSHA